MRHISELRLSFRTFSALRNVGLVDVQELMTWPESRLFSLRNMGRKEVDEVKTALAKRGLGLWR